MICPWCLFSIECDILSQQALALTKYIQAGPFSMRVTNINMQDL